MTLVQRRCTLYGLSASHLLPEVTYAIFPFPTCAARERLAMLVTFPEIVAITTGLAGQWYISQRNPIGFWLWMITNVAMGWTQYANGSYGLAFLMCVYFVMCVYSVVAWDKAEKS